MRYWIQQQFPEETGDFTPILPPAHGEMKKSEIYLQSCKKSWIEMGPDCGTAVA